MSDLIPTGLKPFLTLPPAPGTPGMGKDYRYRKVRDVKADSNDPRSDDLAPFVALSDNDPNISAANADFVDEEFNSEANPGLKGPVRHALYKKWFTLNPDSFLLLDHKGADGQWHPVAVSIVLPLSQAGFEHLQSGAYTAVKLKPDDVIKAGQPDPSSVPHLLLDTWIIDKDFRAGKSHGYGHALITKHLSSFWDPKKQPVVNISVEPDSPEMTSYIEQSHFKKAQESSKFYDLEVNTRTVAASPLMHRVAQNFETCRQWPIEGEPAKPPLGTRRL